MKVYIVNYKGTVYGVFSSEELADRYAEMKFGQSAVMSLAVTILCKELDKEVF